MPGPEVKDWALYEKLRAQGHSKESAARIANAQAAEKKKLPKPPRKKWPLDASRKPTSR